MTGSPIEYIIQERSLKPVFNYLLRFRKLSKFLDLSLVTIKEYVRELEKDGFIENLRDQISQYPDVSTGSMMSPLRGPLLYIIMRMIKPQIIVETGVASGASSAFLLKALEKNNLGHLHSIDIPAIPGNDTIVRLPPDKKPGWLVPDDLRNRWTYHEGKSSIILKPLLVDLKQVDVFIHDSEHTYENMKFEYEIAWPFIKPGGILASDDIKWNAAFSELISEKRPSKILDLYSFGILKK
ncbi:class I SAM-dependent methyltransferase [Candidatus Nitrosotalea okcheonensis]|uniref:Class I SAM-dependent methyltransferase n=1 Tax=Candidatus Nitrosotalea okcheonensis TaxID=1903276 RepID=A0A2H1FHR1_9ARCH|nr:class I SAM-dependent methyltransferase [Candidatus Nitrosotalea okcheonensis]SMH72306.1 protein of unknown function [Candidatus Nitrosotalea okcheonensis]